MMLTTCIITVSSDMKTHDVLTETIMKLINRLLQQNNNHPLTFSLGTIVLYRKLKN